MSRFFTICYAVGFTPWERAGDADAEVLPRVAAEVEEQLGGPGKALDLGCGSGAHVVTLAERGWKVTGVDVVPKALDRARTRVTRSGVSADIVHADVCRLRGDLVGDGFDFLLDIGCFHSLTDSQRADMVAGVSGVAAPDATLLMLAFKRDGVPRLIARGADPDDIASAFQGWQITESWLASAEGMPKPLRRGEPRFYLLRRSG